MTDDERREADRERDLLAYYQATLILTRRYPSPHPLYRALCQVRAELERTLGMRGQGGTNGRRWRG